jgi:hypothetical protein
MLGAVMPMRLVETSDAYPHVVVDFGDGWRVIECAAGLQWILQRRRGGERPWNGRSFCRTKEALLRCAGHCHPALDALPDRFPEAAAVGGDMPQSDFQLSGAMG